MMLDEIQNLALEILGPIEGIVIDGEPSRQLYRVGLPTSPPAPPRPPFPVPPPPSALKRFREQVEDRLRPGEALDVYFLDDPIEPMIKAGVAEAIAALPEGLYLRELYEEGARFIWDGHVALRTAELRTRVFERFFQPDRVRDIIAAEHGRARLQIDRGICMTSWVARAAASIGTDTTLVIAIPAGWGSHLGHGRSMMIP